MASTTFWTLTGWLQNDTIHMDAYDTTKMMMLCSQVQRTSYHSYYQTTVVFKQDMTEQEVRTTFKNGTWCIRQHLGTVTDAVDYTNRRTPQVAKWGTLHDRKQMRIASEPDNDVTAAKAAPSE